MSFNMKTPVAKKKQTAFKLTNRISNSKSQIK